MLNQQIDRIKKEFIQYLDSLKLSPKSHKNYRSDLAHFISWTILKIRTFGSYAESLTEIIPFINFKIASEYKNYMIVNKIPIKTVNRRLSTLRHLSRFLFSSGSLDADFMKNIKNISLAKTSVTKIDPVINDYRAYLESQKISKNTIKNYVSDIQQFLKWAESVNS